MIVRDGVAGIEVWMSRRRRLKLPAFKVRHSALFGLLHHDAQMSNY